MSVRFYDEALVNKIKSWSKNTNLTITSPDETTRLFEITADENKDSIKLPLIAIRRTPNIDLLLTNKKPLTFDAKTLEANEKKSLQLNAIPININYQIDIYTRFAEEADEYVRNFVFNIINFPKLMITLPYHDKDIKHVSNIRLQPTISDNSSIPERFVAGQFTRQTLAIFVDDAYLFDLRYRDNIVIDPEYLELPNGTKYGDIEKLK